MIPAHALTWMHPSQEFFRSNLLPVAYLREASRVVRQPKQRLLCQFASDDVDIFRHHRTVSTYPRQLVIQQSDHRLQ